jgi:hypothetical protein
VLAAALALGLAGPVAGAPVTRVLFVGIDDYAPAVDADLKGAVNDVRLMHRSLSATHRLKLDPLPDGAACEAGGAQSIALLNGCATRVAILDRFDRLVRASAPGDTLVFYFAGHGAQTPLSDGSQASGQSSTLVAADSRTPAPGGGEVDDILDTVLKARIDEATAHGVQVVTIFDSCNSGTATRSADVATRFVGPASATDRADPDGWRARTPPPGVARAARVHLGAAADGQKALEATTGADGRHGRFTRALVEVTAANPGATYGEILQAVRARVTGQTPMGEGPLATTPWLGRAVPTDARLLTAEVSADSLLLFDGMLSGVQPGSGFRLHRTVADALAGRAPLGLARVVEVSAQGARLAPVPAGLKPGELVQALEVARGGSDAPLRVRFEGVDAAEVQAALKGLDGVVAVTEAPDLKVVRADGALRLVDVDGAAIANLSRLSGANDAVRIGEGLRRAANATALLNLPHRPSGQRMGRLELTSDCADCRVVRGVDDPAGPMVRAGDRFRLQVESKSGRPLFPYLFEVTPQFGISRLYPPGGASDQLPAEGFFHVGDAVRAARPGNFRLVLILSEVPLAAGPLEQGSLPRAGGCEGGHALAKLLCAASRGTRAAEALPAGDFDVVTVPVVIGPETEGGGR